MGPVASVANAKSQAVFILFFVLLALAGASASSTAIWLAYGAAFLPYAWLIWKTNQGEGWTTTQILAVGVFCRLLLLPLEPVLSDDIFRYIWEGRVSAAGFNPFAFAPDAIDLNYLRDTEIWPKVNHPDVPTIYPPFAQYLFTLNALMGGGTTLLRGLFLLVEGIFVVMMLRETASSTERTAILAIYALNPLVIVETAWSGHLDVIAWMPAAAALMAWRRRQDSWKWVIVTGACVGLSIGAKFLGVFALIAIWCTRPYWGPDSVDLWKHRAAVAAIAGTVVVVGYLPYVGAKGHLFSGFGTYAAHWRSNDGLFRAERALGMALSDRWASAEQRVENGNLKSEPLYRLENWNAFFEARGWVKTWEGREIPDTSFTGEQIATSLAKVLGALLCFFALLWCVIVTPPLPQRFLVLMGSLLFVAPTVHPWYVAWLVPFAALGRVRWPLIFSGLCLLGYTSWHSVSTGGPWEIPWWVVAIEYGVVVGAVLYEMGRRD